MPTVTELEQQLAEARIAEAEAAKAAEERRKEHDRQMRGLELNATREIDSLKTRIDRALSAKVPASRPSPQTRDLARTFLHRSIAEAEHPLLEAFARGDARWGELRGLNLAAQTMITNMFNAGIRDDGLFAAVDTLETRTWAALIARSQVLAGEV